MSIRKQIAGRLPGASMSFVLINEGTNRDVTPSALQAIAVACEVQLNAEFAAEWGGRYIVRVAPDVVHAGADEVQVLLQDVLPDPNALGYHATTPAGKPIAYIGVAGVTDMVGNSDNALALTISHELLETAADPGANRWEVQGNGTLLALEVCDEVEDTSYRAPNGVYVSNFLFQSYFAPGSVGPYDYLGKLTAQGQETAGGYAILADPPADVHQARERYDAFQARDRDHGAAIAGRKHQVIYASHLPSRNLTKRMHASSRTFRRGVRFGIWQPAPPPTLPDLPRGRA